MFSMLYALAARVKGTILHPQWLTDRFHLISKKCLREIKHSLVLDIGSGDSRHEDFLNASNTLYRLDYPETNVRYRRSPNIYGDACCLPIRTECADAVLLFEVLEHIGSDEQALREIFRVLKPHGRLYISVPFIYPIHDAPTDYRRFTIHGLRFLLNEAGFVSRREIQHGNSFVTALQMFNMAMLEAVRDASKKNNLLGFGLAILAYPLCLTINLIGLPLTRLTWKSASCFGYFLIAERKQPALS